MPTQYRFPYFIGLMLSALPFLTCRLTENRPVQAPAGFDWQGHRGCRGLLPENTIPAFLHALEYPEVVTLELDLAVSGDHQLMVSHEPWFNPAICSKPDGDSIRKQEAESLLLYQMTAAEIQAFDCGSRGNPRFPQQQKTAACKPTFRAVVEAVEKQYPGRPVRWNIEIKSEPAWDGIRTPPVRDFARLVVQEVQRAGLQERVTLQSFDVRPLQIIRALAPGLRLALLVENRQSVEANLKLLGFEPAIYSPNYRLVDRHLVRYCHQRGIKIVPWTVNEVPAMRLLIRIGVDGIITDYPNLIKAVE